MSCVVGGCAFAEVGAFPQRCGIGDAGWASWPDGTIPRALELDHLIRSHYQTLISYIAMVSRESGRASDLGLEVQSYLIASMELQRTIMLGPEDSYVDSGRLTRRIVDLVAGLHRLSGPPEGIRLDLAMADLSKEQCCHYSFLLSELLSSAFRRGTSRELAAIRVRSRFFSGYLTLAIRSRFSPRCGAVEAGPSGSECEEGCMHEVLLAGLARKANGWYCRIPEAGGILEVVRIPQLARTEGAKRERSPASPRSVVTRECFVDHCREESRCRGWAQSAE